MVTGLADMVYKGTDVVTAARRLPDGSVPQVHQARGGRVAIL